MNLDELERRAEEVEGILVHIHRDELSRLVAIARSADKVLKRWDSPHWEWCKQGPTADLFNALREAMEGGK